MLNQKILIQHVRHFFYLTNENFLYQVHLLNKKCLVKGVSTSVRKIEF